MHPRMQIVLTAASLCCALASLAAPLDAGADRGLSEQWLWPALVLILALCGALYAYRHRLKRVMDETAVDKAALQTRVDALAETLQQRTLQCQRATDLRDEWAATVKGELSQQAGTITEAARLLRFGELAPRLREQAETVQSAAYQLRASLSLLTDSAQLEAGKLALAPKVFDFDTLLRDFSDRVVAHPAARGRELIVEVEHDVPQMLLGDAPRLLHLLQAELDLVLTGPVTGDLLFHVGLDRPRVGLPAPPAGTSLLLRFELSGVGMAAATGILERKEQQGLEAMVRAHLLELMGGKAGQRDASGQGSVAWLTAPLQVVDTGAAPVAPIWRGRRVLVVDAKERARTALVNLLSQLGLSVTASSSGFAAIQAAASAEIRGPGFDLVILDGDMPELGGLETVRLMRNHGLRDLPIMVLLSSTPLGTTLAEAQAAGVAEVLRKPLDRQAVRQMLNLLLLPSDEDAQPPAPPKVQREAGTPAAVRVLGGARVLLVEDNEINQQIALELLQASGMEVQIAIHGQAALELLNWQYFDLVLMDLQMPVLDGLAATRLIRADRRHLGLPIIAMTAAGSQLERERCLAAGMNAHLVKPFDLDSLWSALQRWITPRPGLGLQDIGAPMVEKPAQPDFLTAMATMPGFEVRRALHRMGNRFDLYMRTARMFVDTQGDTVEQVREALAAGDRQTAIRLATTLKNLAGNLGAEGLQTEALALEAALREGAADSPTHARTARVEEALEVACFALRPMLAAAAAKAPRPGVSAAVAGPAD